jgi:hypothetical protein
VDSNRIGADRSLHKRCSAIPDSWILLARRAEGEGHAFLFRQNTSFEIGDETKNVAI